MTPFVLRHQGRELQVTVADDAVTIEAAAQPRRIPLADIRSVRVARIGTVEMFELELGEGGKQAVATDDRECRARFAELVRALYERLAPRGVTFVSGAWFLVVVVFAIAVVCGTLAGLVVAGVIDAPAFVRRAWVVMILCVLMGPVALWKARPKPLADRAALDAVLPR